MKPVQIGIVGTGAVARFLGRAWAAKDHQVTLGTRDPEQTRAREEWADVDLPLAAYADLEGEVYVNATRGDASLAALQAVGPALNQKVVIDTSNALDTSRGFPPTLFVDDSDSLAEQLQRALPEARLVKMFNTMNHRVMVDPSGLGEQSTIFLAGNDDAARQTATELAADLGWTDVFDLGDLTGARGMEMYMPLWLRIYGALGRPDFNIKVIR
jgi:8-hydroxy-5-deazaflavin:NADPH oxidoreductase